MDFESINPYNNEVVYTHEATALDNIDVFIKKGHSAYLDWKDKTYEERAVQFQHLRQMLINLTEEYGAIATNEMGKPLVESAKELKKCAKLCDFYSKNAKAFLATEFIETEHYKTMVTYEPIGVILGVMPWNYPFWQIMRFAIPTMMAGNAVVVKPAPNTFQCAKALQHLFWEAGFPRDIFQVLFIPEILTELAIKDIHIQGVAFTGSTKGGSIIASRAGKYLKKSVLELGGNDACIILPDADIKAAVEKAVASRFGNAGQACIATKRLIIHKDIKHLVMPLLQEAVEALKVGNPMLKETNIGPLARPDLVENIERQVNESVEMGAEILIGGKRIKDTNFFEPTILTNIPKESPAYKEELFGPVLSVFVVDSEEEAIELTNDSIYGLAAAVWTRDFKRGEKVAKQLNVGTVAINARVSSDARMPFGGVKQSGYGRELSVSGIREFVNQKSIVVA
ncbi:MAG: NAD-dependent succinate-semialdehyde dehydrogenase [Saprospiraceae bacterium]